MHSTQEKTLNHCSQIGEKKTTEWRTLRLEYGGVARRIFFNRMPFPVLNVADTERTRKENMFKTLLAAKRKKVPRRGQKVGYGLGDVARRASFVNLMLFRFF